MTPDEIDTLCLDMGDLMDDVKSGGEIPEPMQAEPPHRRQGDKDLMGQFAYFVNGELIVFCKCVLVTVISKHNGYIIC